MRVLIIRHAHAEEREDWNLIGKPDELRPLTKKGIFRFADVAMGLMKLIDSIEIIFTSELIRSIQTAELLVKGFPGSRVEIIENLNPGKDQNQMLPVIEKLIQGKTYAFIGHQPELERLISQLMASHSLLNFRLKKGGAVLLEKIDQNWHMHWMLNSKQLAAIK